MHRYLLFFNLMKWLSFQKKQQMTGWQTQLKKGTNYFYHNNQTVTTHTKKTWLELIWCFFWVAIFISSNIGEKKALFCVSGFLTWRNTGNTAEPNSLCYPHLPMLKTSSALCAVETSTWPGPVWYRNFLGPVWYITGFYQWIVKLQSGFPLQRN